MATRKPQQQLTVCKSGKYVFTLDERNRLVSISFRRSPVAVFGTLSEKPTTLQRETAIKISAQLDEYYSGKRKIFHVAITPRGTEFQKLIWKTLCAVPYGDTVSYAELARRSGKPRAVRATAGAVGKNPIGIIIPCHRVIASNGTLGGFSAGLGDGNPKNEKNLLKKKSLIDLEKKYR